MIPEARSTAPQGRVASTVAPEKVTEETAEKLTPKRRYTSKDVAALRAWVQRIPPAVIARIYYDPQENAHAATPGAWTASPFCKY